VFPVVVLEVLEVVLLLLLIVANARIPAKSN